jgi:hypothetical protein
VYIAASRTKEESQSRSFGVLDVQPIKHHPGRRSAKERRLFDHSHAFGKRRRPRGPSEVASARLVRFAKCR